MAQWATTKKKKMRSDLLEDRVTVLCHTDTEKALQIFGLSMRVPLVLVSTDTAESMQARP